MLMLTCISWYMHIWVYILWMEEILHHFFGFQFIGQAAMSPHPLFNFGR